MEFRRTGFARYILVSKFWNRTKCSVYRTPFEISAGWLEGGGRWGARIVTDVVLIYFNPRACSSRSHFLSEEYYAVYLMLIT
jgi:hypothetical protein